MNSAREPIIALLDSLPDIVSETQSAEQGPQFLALLALATKGLGGERGALGVLRVPCKPGGLKNLLDVALRHCDPA